MKVMGKFVTFYVGLMFGLVAVACDYQGQPEPPNGIIKETMTVEYDFISGFDAGSDNRAFPEIRDNVKQAYMQTGTTFLPYRDDAHILPYYVAGSPNSRFPNNDTDLRNYAKNNRNAINGSYMNYHYLSVNYFASNAGGLFAPGGAIGGPNNQTPTPEDERYTFLFWGDILAFISNPTTIRQLAVLVSAHELGHQRIGLTHWDLFTIFHNNPGQPQCAMREDFSFVPMTPIDYRLNPVFCFDTDAVNTNSCRDWLKQANP
jgi:hypothetical protein